MNCRRCTYLGAYGLSYFVFAYNDEGAGSENREWYGFLFFGE